MPEIKKLSRRNVNGADVRDVPGFVVMPNSGWKPSFVIHDEVQYEGRTTLDDFVWARDSNGVVHLWYKIEGSEGFAGCDVAREDIQQFFVEEVDVTCLGCLATKGSVPDGALSRQLVVSLRALSKAVGAFAPGHAKATLALAEKMQDVNDKTGYVQTLRGRRRRFR